MQQATKFKLLRSSPTRFVIVSLRVIVVSLLAFFASAQSLPACSIPVFRFALERWAPDLFEVSVFYRGTLNDADAKRLNQLEDLAVHNGGSVNLEVVRCDLDDRVPPDLLALWQPPKDGSLPTVIVRTPRRVTGQSIVWQGRLSDPFLDTLGTSPARREVVQRLLQGDAVVWLLVRGTDKQQAARARAALDSALENLADQIELPPGVGQPGSELRTRIPLHLKFSVVELSADSRAEQALVKLLHGGFAKPPLASDSYLAPVFGRGRVLNVQSAREVDSDSISDLTRYLCGACSCQVKQQNPGFDLLCAMNWEERLFGETSDPAPDTASDSTTDSEPTLIAIPSGHASHVARTSAANPAHTPSDGGHRGFLLVFAALAVMASLIVIRNESTR
ncbi:MAG: hypothetical protein IAG10_21050 [Planctomycetaceae bacterium]|nr:hypothetical protein [Planctomycetaceae bacterium]